MTRKLQLEDLDNLFICDCGTIFHEYYGKEYGESQICSACAYREINKEDN